MEKLCEGPENTEDMKKDFSDILDFSGYWIRFEFLVLQLKTCQLHF